MVTAFFPLKRLLLCFAGMALAVAVSAQSPAGIWRTVDDETGESKSHVQIYEQNGQLYGKVVKLLREKPDKTCDKCPGERKDKPVLNMIIMEKMQLKDGFWQAGQILDPEKGKWYTGSIWLKDGDPNVLAVRGYIGFLYRTQYWYRVQ